MNTAEVLNKPVHIGPRRMCHANLFVSSVAESLKFYNQVCGLEIVLEQPSINAGFLSNGNTHHDIGMLQTTKAAVMGENGHRILANNQGSDPGLYHLGWEMESEFELVNAYKRALAAGYRIHRTVRHRASNSIYLFDPDGNIHEFYADVDKNWRDLYRSLTTVSGQWEPDAARASTIAKYHLDPPIMRVEEAPMHPARFSHAVLVARNFENVQLFYSNILGLPEVYRSEDKSVVAYGSRSGVYPVTVAIVDAMAIQGDGMKSLHHIAFQVADVEGVDEGEAALRRLDINVERSVDSASKRSVFIRDPDGTLVEFCSRKASWKPADITAANAFEI
ncbi:MAG: dioxygenase [Paucimonas sp.]|nr:dioxygenase [Paucimonas sp.]